MYNGRVRCVRTTIVVVEKECVTCYECVFAVLGTLREIRMRRIVICGVSGTTIFSHII